MSLNFTTPIDATAIAAPKKTPEQQAWEDHRLKPAWDNTDWWHTEINHTFNLDDVSMYFCQFQIAKENLSEAQWLDLADKLGVTAEELSEIATVSDHLSWRYTPTGADLTKLARVYLEVFANRD